MHHQREKIVIQCLLDARQPVCFLAAAGKLQIIARANVYTIAPVLLGEIAGVVGGGKNVRDTLIGTGDRYQADARTYLEARTPPDEAKRTDGFAQILRQAFRLLETAMLDDDAEFIASKTGEGVPLAHLTTQQSADFFQ